MINQDHQKVFDQVVCLLWSEFVGQELVATRDERTSVVRRADGQIILTVTSHKDGTITVKKCGWDDDHRPHYVTGGTLVPLVIV